MTERHHGIMPETNESCLCICITEPITEAWFLNNMSILERIRSQRGEIRFLVYYKTYQGWEEDASRADAGAFIETGKHFRKFAYVNPPHKTLLRHKMRMPMFSGEFRAFNESDLDEALRWVKS